MAQRGNIYFNFDLSSSFAVSRTNYDSVMSIMFYMQQLTNQYMKPKVELKVAFYEDLSFMNRPQSHA